MDLWAGTRDVDGAEPWAVDTVQIVRSAGKGIAAAVPLLLHQRGQVDLDAPVGTYWPEFKANGKERVLVRHLLAHRSGVAALDTTLTPEEAADQVSGPRAVAEQRPQWEPGTDHGYHAQTYSWIVGELVRRVTGRTIGRWIAEEIARPLGLDFWFGLPEDEAHRIGRIGPVEPPCGRRQRCPADAPQAVRRRRLRRPGLAHPARLRGDRPLPRRERPGLPRGRTPRVQRRRDRAGTRPLLRRHDRRGRRAPAVRPGDPHAGPHRGVRGPDRVLVVNTRFGLGYMLHGPSAPLLGPGSFGHPGRGARSASPTPNRVSRSAM